MRIAVHRSAAFTLLEIVVVIAILGILVALALPTYQDSVMKGRRAEAQATLREVEMCAARFLTAHGSYTADVGVNVFCNAEAWDGDDGAGDEGSYYAYSFSNVTAITYTVQAAPQGAQASDKCGTMALVQSGATSAADSACWPSAQNQ